MPTKIEWCDETWNPIKMRCTPVSEGCQNCYVGPLLNRNLPGLRDYPKPGEPPRLDVKELNKPFRWQKPKRIFVESMGDLFHEDVPFYMIDAVLDVIIGNPQHTFIVLTKRPENIERKLHEYDKECIVRVLAGGDYLPNVWLGVTAENQRCADERIPILLQIPAAVHFVSVEPMLGMVNLIPYLPDPLDGSAHIPNIGDFSPLDWGILGAETGPGARLINANWVGDFIQQFRAAGVPVFFKKWGKTRSGLFKYSLPADKDMPREFPNTG